MIYCISKPEANGLAASQMPTLCGERRNPAVYYRELCQDGWGDSDAWRHRYPPHPAPGSFAGDRTPCYFCKACAHIFLYINLKDVIEWASIALTSGILRPLIVETDPVSLVLVTNKLLVEAIGSIVKQMNVDLYTSFPLIIGARVV